MNSHFFKINYQVNGSDVSSIRDHLLRCDMSFVPPLSSYVNIQEYSRKLFDKAVNFEALHDGRLIGLVSAYYAGATDRMAYVSNVSVEMRYQRQGIASTLLLKAITHAERENLSGVKLETYLGNKGALALYCRLGFEKQISNSGKVLMIKYL